ncbi:MAG TPA: macro domain-containing protein, partial [Balneolaceae bacterium]|nr:macro domain-containing protein [Balneolaceae bacterium]
EENDISSIAFPSISTGAFGYPMKAAARVAFRTIKQQVPELSSVKKIRFVLWGEDAMSIHEQVMDEVFE